MSLFEGPFFDVKIGEEIEKDITVEYEMMYNESNGYGSYAVSDNFD